MVDSVNVPLQILVRMIQIIQSNYLQQPNELYSGGQACQIWALKHHKYTWVLNVRQSCK